MRQTLSENEMQRARLLLDFIQITKDGMTKPYDPTPILTKINQFERDHPDGNLKDLKNCCPEVAIIKDAKDFKPFIMGALEQFAEVMDIKVENQRRRY